MVNLQLIATVALNMALQFSSPRSFSPALPFLHCGAWFQAIIGIRLFAQSEVFRDYTQPRLRRTGLAAKYH